MTERSVLDTAAASAPAPSTRRPTARRRHRPLRLIPTPWPPSPAAPGRRRRGVDAPPSWRLCGGGRGPRRRVRLPARRRASAARSTTSRPSTRPSPTRPCSGRRRSGSRASSSPGPCTASTVGVDFVAAGTATTASTWSTPATRPQLFQPDIPVVVVGHFSGRHLRVRTRSSWTTPPSTCQAHPNRVRAPNGTDAVNAALGHSGVLLGLAASVVGVAVHRLRPGPAPPEALRTGRIYAGLVLLGAVRRHGGHGAGADHPRLLPRLRGRQQQPRHAAALHDHRACGRRWRARSCCGD